MICTPPKTLFQSTELDFRTVWSILYLIIGVSAARLWNHDSRGRAIGIWWFQMALNLLWSPMFFQFHRVDLAFADIVALLAVIVAFIVTAWREDRIAAALFVPYGVWAGFASILNGAILALN